MKSKYPHVTEVLNLINEDPSGFLVSKYDYEGFREMIKSAGEWGKKFHYVTALIDKGFIKNESHPGILATKVSDIRLYNAVMRYWEWKDIAVEKVLCTEFYDINIKYGYQGKSDGLFILKGEKRPLIIDKKTSSGISWKPYVQINAYAKLPGIAMQKPWRGLILHCPKNGAKPKPYDVKLNAESFNLFKSMLKTYNMVNNYRRLHNG